jgi:hypothetical protein
VRFHHYHVVYANVLELLVVAVRNKVAKIGQD